MNSMENQPKVIVIGQKIMIGEVAKVKVSNFEVVAGNQFSDNSCHCTDTVYTFGQYEYDNEFQEKLRASSIFLRCW